MDPARPLGGGNGDALADHAFAARVVNHGFVRVVVHVDEAGGDYKVGCVDGAVARGGFEVADGGDAVVADSDVGLTPGGARAVDEQAVFDYEVEGGLLGCGGEEAEEYGERVTELHSISLS